MALISQGLKLRFLWVLSKDVLYIPFTHFSGLFVEIFIMIFMADFDMTIIYLISSGT